jgi:cupin 2 domain-containing protein
MKIFNIFQIGQTPDANADEIVERLLACGDVTIERIISAGQASPENFWYDQPSNEWVVLLQGNAAIEFENEGISELSTGDYLYIPAHYRHRITHTSSAPPCIWLAVHFNDT